MPLTSSLARHSLLALALSSLLAGCGGSDSDNDHSDHDHDHTDLSSAGRLALFDADSGDLRVLDLDSGDELDRFALDGSTPRLYSSPDKRYAVVIQREDNKVSFLDGGLYTEDHGDHMHDYAESPQWVGLTLNATRPTHYTVHDHHAVVFFDGSDAASSSISVLSDSGIGGGQAVASLDLENNMHGVAKLLDDKLFVTYRDAAITDTTLPAEVERYHFDGDAFILETRYDLTCPGLHGAAANHHALAFGCTDGLLVIDLAQNGQPARKLANPAGLADDARIGTLRSHPALEKMVAYAYSSQQYFVVDPEAGDAASAYQALSLPQGVRPLVGDFDPHGHHFYVLGSDGVLRLFDAEGDWQQVAEVTVAGPFSEDDAAPSITASAEHLYVLVPGERSLKTIDSHDGELLATQSLDYTATAVTWLGFAEDDHGHDDHNH